MGSWGRGVKKPKIRCEEGESKLKNVEWHTFWMAPNRVSFSWYFFLLCASFFSINLDTSFFFLLSSSFFLLSSFFFLLSSFVLFLLRAPTPLFPPLFPFYSMLSDFLTVSGRHSPPPFFIFTKLKPCDTAWRQKDFKSIFQSHHWFYSQSRFPPPTWDVAIWQ